MQTSVAPYSTVCSSLDLCLLIASGSSGEIRRSVVEVVHFPSHLLSAQHPRVCKMF
jgi:hypothetical protein